MPLSLLLLSACLRPSLTRTEVDRIPDAPVPPWAPRLGLPTELLLPEDLGPTGVVIDSPRLGRLLCVPPGRFMMGSPDAEDGRDVDEAAHPVLLSGFCAMRTEVTQAMVETLSGVNPATQIYDGISLGGPAFPVQNMEWTQAVTFANAVSAEEGLSPAYRIYEGHVEPIWGADGYRLLTEAEWEYVARAGTDTPYAGTASEVDVCQFGNVSDATAGAKWQDWDTFACSDGYAGLAPVASFAPNPWGFYDLTGNAAEWVWDRFGPYPQGTVLDPDGPPEGDQRVIRGGACYGGPDSQRIAHRDRSPPDTRFYLLGFRLARGLP